MLRWGLPPEVGPISNRPAAIDERPAPVHVSKVTAADTQLVKDLLHALADHPERPLADLRLADQKSIRRFRGASCRV